MSVTKRAGRVEKVKKPKSKRKVLLMAAEDALKTLRVLIPRRGIYIRPEISKTNMAFYSDDGPAVLQQRIPMIAKNCEVCAKGALLLSCVRLFDGEESLSGASRKTRDAFGDKEADLIENVFESESDDPDFPKWGAIEDDKKRLRAILKNIVGHGGVFRPEIAPGKEPKP